MATLTARFTDMAGNPVSITITSATIPADGTLTLGKDPLHITMSQPDDKYPGVRTFEAEISVLTRDSLAFLYSDDPLATNVTITRNARTLFRGYLMPSEWQQPMTPGEWNEVSIVAIDALAALKNVWFTDRCLVRGTQDSYGTPSLVGLLKQHCGSDITVSYQSGTEGILDGYFSSEAFIGTDFDKEDAHTAIGEMFQDYARATGITLTMITNTLYVYRTDSEAVNSSTLILAGTDVSMEMIPPVRRVKGEWDAIPDVEKPRSKNVTTTIFTYDTDERMNVPYSTVNDWEPYQWPNTFTGWNGVKPTLFGSGAKEPQNSDLFPGLGCRQKPEASHIYVPYNASFNMGFLSLTYKVHNNQQRDDDVQTKRMALLPDDCVANTIRENAVAGSVKLSINDTTIAATTVDNVYGLDTSVPYNDRLELFEDSKWGAARLQFNLSDYNAHLIRNRGRIQMQVVSWWGSNRPTFVKDIHLEASDNDNAHYTANANGSPVFDDLDIDTCLCTSHIGQSIGTIGAPTLTHYAATRSAMDTLAAQYATVHTQWTIDCEDGYLSGTLANVTRHVTFQGKRHTIQAFDWNLRKNTTEITILEDYKQ